eukprot:1426414-Ditylum_brightwellii.AAC.1
MKWTQSYASSLTCPLPPCQKYHSYNNNIQQSNSGHTGSLYRTNRPYDGSRSYTADGHLAGISCNKGT